MELPLLEIYSDIHCPWAYLANFRLRQIWPAYKGKLQLKWRALSLEFINEHGTPKDILEQETDLMQQQVEPNLPIQQWPTANWEWPVTIWPAFEALACAQAQGEAQAFEMSWALRYAFFAESRSISLRHELFAVAEQVAKIADLDVPRFKDDWDSGRYKIEVYQDSERGWHALKVKNSPTFVLPNSKQYSNPAAGEFKLDLKNGHPSYTPPDREPLEVYREILDEASSSTKTNG